MSPTVAPLPMVGPRAGSVTQDRRLPEPKGPRRRCCRARQKAWGGVRPRVLTAAAAGPILDLTPSVIGGGMSFDLFRPEIDTSFPRLERLFEQAKRDFW